MSDAAKQTILSDYAAYTDSVRVRNSKVACALVIALMPAGIVLDWKVYPNDVSHFFFIRLISSLLAGLVLARLFAKKLSATETNLLCAGWWVIPSVAISWMIGAKDGVMSPYYAGLCLVILAVSTVIQATMKQSLRAVLFILSLYVGACLLNKNPVEWQRDEWRMFLNNIYFITLTTIIVMAGNVFYNRLRFREFTLRHELADSTKKVEEKNVQLDSQNKTLSDTIQKLTEAESQLVQSEKMASLGRMSAGIIHEINNPLNFATTGLFTLRKKSRYIAPEQLEEYNDILKDVEEGVSRVKNIVSDLRMFTHPSTDNLDSVEVSEVVTSALRFLSNEMKDKVNIEQKLAEGQVVYGNKNKLIHVFVNLLQNSLDALKTKPFNNGERPTIWIESLDNKDLASLIVRDNGPGISAEHRDKIFDPFYTTKDVGEGMGLGLSICYRIMQESKGRIVVSTEPGKFCEFKLEFPKESKAEI